MISHRVNQRLRHTATLCDELLMTMEEIQARLEQRRTTMRISMRRMAQGLRVQGRR